MATAKRRLVVARKDTFEFYDLVIYAARNSSSARDLAKALKARRWFENPPDRYARRRPFFRGRPNPTIVNWGSTIRPDWGLVREVVGLAEKRGQYLNSAAACAKAINKLETFKCLTAAEVPTLKWTTAQAEAAGWLTGKKAHDVFARRVLQGQGGAGITVISSGGNLIPAPLYTRNYPKTHEFRVHVFDGRVIDFVEKKAKVENGNVAVRDRLVRNHANGWVFAHDNLSPDANARREIEQHCVAAIRSVGLLFGAVDVLAILNEGNGPRSLKSCAVCEINTAPGLECTQTIAAYTTAIRNHHLTLRGR